MRIVSYNIQAAIGSDGYLSHFTRLHHQFMPSDVKQQNLMKIARYISQFDIACLQEIDLGGYRNGFQNQVEQFLAMTPFRYYQYQINRTLGKLSIHGNLILSKLPLQEVINSPLPSRIKGRGMLAAAVHSAHGEIIVANAHLSLGRNDQIQQVEFITKQLEQFPNICLMGDFNCAAHALPLQILTNNGYQLFSQGLTYPSWKPTQSLDHIFIKGNFSGSSQITPFYASDHLPVEIQLDV